VTLVAMKTLRGRARLGLLVAAAVAAPAPMARAQEAEAGGAGALGGAPIETTADHPPEGPLPRVRWYTLDTPHFHIHYYAEERAYAEHAAIIAERAFRLNTRFLNWLPSGRVNITLEDQTDFADGFASSIPQNFVFGFGAPPGSLDELNDFDDYLKLLLTHELTHVVHLDTILGFARFYNAVFGKLYAPNLSQPNWFVEGLAVLNESRQSTAGRLRSAIFAMELRVPFLEGRVLGLDAVSNGPLVFPNGTAAYLYGSSLLKYIEDRYGPLVLREISFRYGGSLIPGAMNRVAAEATGAGYASVFRGGLWDDWRRSQSHKYALEAEDAARRGLTVERRITHDAPGPRGDGFTPGFFPDGTILYHRINNDQSPAFVRLDAATGKAHVLAEIYGAGRVVPTPDGRALVYHRQSLLPLRWRISGASNLSWNDVFRLDLATGEERELTRARRAEEPDVSPDGKLVACTVGGPGTRQLAVMPIEGGVPRVLGAELPGFAYSPAFSPDGRLIAYSRWTPGGFRDIHVYELATGADRALSHDRAMDVDPRFAPDGHTVVFSSDRTGIYNIFAFDLETGQLAQVTNVLAGAFQPAISPDGKRLVYMGFTSEGYDLYEAPFDPWSWLPAQPFANARPNAPADPGSVADSPDAQPGEVPVTPFPVDTTSYKPWKYLYPHSWVLKLLPDPFGIGNSVEAQFSVSDPVGNHAFNFDAIIPGSGDASLRLDYAYNLVWPQFGITLTRTSLLANDLFIDGARADYKQHSQSASGFVSLPVLRTPASSGDVSFGYTYAAYAPADTLPAADPTLGITIPPERGPDANLYVTWAFSNAHSWPYSISFQEGRRLQLSLRVSDPALGGRFHTTEVSWFWTEYLTPPWARLQAIALLYSGGVGIGDKRQFFQLGGYVQQDLLRALFLNQPQGCCTYLRGYAPGAVVGDQYHLVSAEYRTPLLWFERSKDTFPVYLRRLNGAAFVDAGDAFFGALKLGDVRYGVGTELRLEATFIYYIEAEILAGFARGLSKDGGNHAYVVFSFPF
jgi:Tol biopolymer transport system component